jgi:tRNA dimethylallyltransferase
MDIGTAKPSAADRARVPHRGLDLRAPDEDFSAADFVAEAEAALAAGGPVVVCGGTPFYLRAFWRGLVAAPAADAAVRARFEALENPHEALAAVDPVLAARLHPNDRVRVIRGLEVHALTGTPLSALHAADDQPPRPLETIWVDSEALDARIDARVHTMMAAGYLDEVRALLAAGYGPEVKPMRTLGYRHLTAHLMSGLPLEEAVRLTQQDTRRFARKQRTFLRGLGLVPGGDAWAAARRAFGG